MSQNNFREPLGKGEEEEEEKEKKEEKRDDEIVKPESHSQRFWPNPSQITN